MNNVFYLHPRKCGGTSVRHALKSLNTNLLLTSELELTETCISKLERNEKVIVFGHLNQIQKPTNDQEMKIYTDIYKNLYGKFNLIVPTRNPCNLVQSWMHFSVKRSVNALKMILKNKDEILSERTLGMLLRTSKLKQDGIIYNSESLEIERGSSFPLIELKKADEIYNLLTFIDDAKRSEKSFSLLMSMTMELCAGQPSLIQDKFFSGEGIDIEPPETDVNRHVLYYDVENITLRSSRLLDRLIVKGFSEKLKNTQLNSSQTTGNTKASEFTEVEAELRNLCPSEWKIFERSQT